MQELDEQRRPRDARLNSRLSVNQMTFKGTTFEDDIETCRDVGVRGLGVEAQKLEYGRDEEFAELLAAADIQATLCVPATPSILPVELFGGSQNPQVRIDEMIASITRFARFRPSQFHHSDRGRRIAGGFRAAAHRCRRISSGVFGRC